MNRNLRRAPRGRAFAATALLLGGLPAPAAALPLISEVFYDAVGSDTGQSFVELYGTPETDLTGFTVEGINGSNGAVTDSVALSGLIPADGIFVLADDQGDGTTLVENADLIGRFDFQNGPDLVRSSRAGAPTGGRAGTPRPPRWVSTGEQGARYAERRASVGSTSRTAA